MYIALIVFQAAEGGGMLAPDSNRISALREAAINVNLNHPNIVATYGHDVQPLSAIRMGVPGGGEDLSPTGKSFADWQMFIIQEYCDGGSLLKALEGKAFFTSTAADEPDRFDSSKGSTATPPSGIPKLDLVLPILAQVGPVSPAPAPALACHPHTPKGYNPQLITFHDPCNELPPHCHLAQIARGCAYIHSKNIIHGEEDLREVLCGVEG